ncbi:helix-hairpin-helix domain-containing protein [Cellulomonas sp. ATA003]|uniref:helix-hairpin-helix domain-containing protein n=1 Tax=Cellulomonas sp. ATA003 TaxID=3073064 RepID=UPI002872B351|nr:helix-hairpin-helix domain-containing protein [Cellulomonas sp. ATA003]WNB84615.1 helix-hairpin-helix domain-containing protein [Cellulomonas sp. ATA003]
MRAEALGTAAAAYTDTYGHPLEHGRHRPDRPDRPALRWGLTVRHAAVAGVAVAVLATGVVVRTAAVVPDPATPVGTVAVTSVPGTAERGTAGPGTVGPGTAGPGTAGPGTTASGTAGPGTAGSGTAADGGPVGAPGAASVPDGAARVVVHVVGQVAAPGVVDLPAGSRVADALHAAGGATASADLSAVNLARVLQDGEQVLVPAPGQVPPPPPGAGTPAGTTGAAATGGAATGVGDTAAPIDINRADLAALDALPGIGPVLAQRILDWRAGNGPFRDVGELVEVAGIGEALLERLRPLVRV